MKALFGMADTVFSSYMCSWSSQQSIVAVCSTRVRSTSCVASSPRSARTRKLRSWKWTAKTTTCTCSWSILLRRSAHQHRPPIHRAAENTRLTFTTASLSALSFPALKDGACRALWSTANLRRGSHPTLHGSAARGAPGARDRMAGIRPSATPAAVRPPHSGPDQPCGQVTSRRPR